MSLVTGLPYQGGILGDSQLRAERTNISGTLRRRVLVNIGATGAPTLSPTGTAFAIVRNSTGNYSITYPVQVSGSTCYLRVGVAQSAATTVAQATVTAIAPTSGTATFVTALNAAGTAVDPANGDILWMELVSDDLNSQ